MPIEREISIRIDLSDIESATKKLAEFKRSVENTTEQVNALTTSIANLNKALGSVPARKISPKDITESQGRC